MFICIRITARKLEMRPTVVCRDDNMTRVRAHIDDFDIDVMNSADRDIYIFLSNIYIVVTPALHVRP